MLARLVFAPLCLADTPFDLVAPERPVAPIPLPELERRDVVFPAPALPPLAVDVLLLTAFVEEARGLPPVDLLAEDLLAVDLLAEDLLAEDLDADVLLVLVLAEVPLVLLVELFAPVFAAADLALLDVFRRADCWALRIAAISSSLRIACAPVTPISRAASARSRRVCVCRSALVIKRKALYGVG